ncbi:tetratricopeptide repeat protein [Pedobacter lithocola]|uniref:histidine kinase n=1 Tax=Pedobacter lithocola TaxID=1908239 RepID=A0ABV8P896_9SPHI
MTDSAFRYFNIAKDVFLQERDSLGVGKCLLNMAIFSTDKGDYFGGQELSLSAIRFFDPSDTLQYVFIRSNYNNLGIASYKLKDYTHALGFYDQAIRFSDDPLDTRVYLNNQAKLYQEMGRYGKALEIYTQVLSGLSRNRKDYARALSNVAMARWLQRPKADVLEDFRQALRIRKEEKDNWGLNASYSHLSDYYASKSPSKALAYADSMYHVAVLLKSSDDEILALKKIIRLSPGEQARPYFKIYEQLDDSLKTARSGAKNQFALIRYESEKHKADNLLLQKKNAAKNYQLGMVVFIALLVLVLVGVQFRIRRKKLAQAAEKKIQESELTTSKQVHDVVANGLYRIMKEIQNRLHSSAESLLDRIEVLYEKSRDISYNRPAQREQPFELHLSGLLGSFSGEETRVVIVGNGPEIWANVALDVLYEIEQVLQELMINMSRHSGADHVVLRLQREEKRVTITYRDNGKGMAEGDVQGNGLRSTGNRIDAISGSIIFEAIPGARGLKVSVSFPV